MTLAVGGTLNSNTTTTSELRVRLARCKTGLSPPLKYFTDRSKAVLLLWIFYVFSVLCLLCLCVRLFLCTLWLPAGKGLTSWLSFVVSNCELLFFYFPIGILGQMWYLIVSIPDLCTLNYLAHTVQCVHYIILYWWCKFHVNIPTSCKSMVVVVTSPVKIQPNVTKCQFDIALLVFSLFQKMHFSFQNLISLT